MAEYVKATPVTKTTMWSQRGTGKAVAIGSKTTSGGKTTTTGIYSVSSDGRGAIKAYSQMTPEERKAIKKEEEINKRVTIGGKSYSLHGTKKEVEKREKKLREEHERRLAEKQRILELKQKQFKKDEFKRKDLEYTKGIGQKKFGDLTPLETEEVLFKFKDAQRRGLESEIKKLPSEAEMRRREGTLRAEKQILEKDIKEWERKAWAYRLHPPAWLTKQRLELERRIKELDKEARKYNKDTTTLRGMGVYIGRRIKEIEKIKAPQGLIMQTGPRMIAQYFPKEIKAAEKKGKNFTTLPMGPEPDAEQDVKAMTIRPPKPKGFSKKQETFSEFVYGPKSLAANIEEVIGLSGEGLAWAGYQPLKGFVPESKRKTAEKQAMKTGRVIAEIGTIFAPGPLGKSRIFQSALTSEKPETVAFNIGLGALFGAGASSIGKGSRLVGLQLGTSTAGKLWRAGEKIASKVLIPGFFAGYFGLTGLELGTAMKEENWKEFDRMSRESTASASQFIIGTMGGAYATDKVLTPLESRIAFEVGVRKLSPKQAKEARAMMQLAERLGAEYTFLVNEPSFRSVKKLKPPLITPAREFFQEGDVILGGSAAMKAQLPSTRGLRPTGDLDAYARHWEKQAKEIYRNFEKTGLERISKLEKGSKTEITVKGEKAVEIHDIERFQQNVDSVRKLLDFKTTVRSPKGIEMMRLDLQLKRKVWGGYLEGRPQDIFDFKKAAEILEPGSVARAMKGEVKSSFDILFEEGGHIGRGGGIKKTSAEEKILGVGSRRGGSRGVFSDSYYLSARKMASYPLIAEPIRFGYPTRKGYNEPKEPILRTYPSQRRMDYKFSPILPKYGKLNLSIKHFLPRIKKYKGISNPKYPTLSTETFVPSYPQMVISPPSLYKPIKETPPVTYNYPEKEIEMRKFTRRILPLPRDDRKKKTKTKRFGPLFETFVKRKGKFEKVSEAPMGKTKALELGRFLTEHSPAATFKIKEAGWGEISGIKKILNLGKYYRKKDVLIEKTKYRIDTPGELKGITVEGLKELRRQKRLPKFLKKKKKRR